MTQALHEDSDLTKVMHDAAKWTTASMAPGSFWGSSLYHIIMPTVINAVDSAANLPIPNVAIAPFIGGIASFITGVRQLNDTTTHRPEATKIKGLTNILGSFSILTTTGLSMSSVAAVGSVALGPAGAAAFVGVNFALSLDATKEAIMRWSSERYWLEDTCKILQKNDELLAKARAKTAELAQIANPSTNIVAQLQAQQQAQAELAKKRDQLIADLNTKIQYIQRKPNNAQSLATLDDLFVKKYPDPANAQNWRSKISTQQNNSNQQTIDTQHHDLVKKSKEEVFDATVNSFVWGLAFAGMVLLCIPGLQIPAAGVLAAAGALFVGNMLRKKLQQQPTNQAQATTQLQTGTPATAAPALATPVPKAPTNTTPTPKTPDKYHQSDPAPDGHSSQSTLTAAKRQALFTLKFAQISRNFYKESIDNIRRSSESALVGQNENPELHAMCMRHSL